MPTAPVDDKGTHLYYEDTGAPPGSIDYSTLILIHGAVLHCGVYRRVFAYAAKHNLRMVAVTLRDYPGSAPYSSDELAVLRGTDKDAQESFIRDRGLEITAFLAWFIQKENISPYSPPADSRKAKGGLSVLAWSWGNCISISFLAHIREAPVWKQVLLDAYLRAFIIFDPNGTATATALPTAEEVYSIWNDPSLTPERQSAAFPLWVSGYYKHAPAVLEAFASLPRAELCAGLVSQPHEDPIPTLHRMSPQEFSSISDVSATTRSHMYMKRVDRAIYTANVRAALANKAICPGLRVSLIWCDMSVCETIIGSWGLTKMVREEWPEDGRKVEVVRMEGANHFPHWDEPERTVDLWASLL